MQVNLTLPTQTELESVTKIALDSAQSLKIDSPAMYASAARELQEIKGRAKALDEKRKAITAPLDAAKKAVMDLFRSPLATLEQAESVIKRAIVAWDSEQERLRKAEEMRLREVARKERERLEAEARKAEEVARKKSEELKLKAEAQAAAGNVEKANALLEKASATLESASDKAAALQQQASIVQAPTVVREQSKVAGISMRTLWRARVVDASLVPREYMLPNETALNKVAEATKGSIKIPGVEIYSEQSVAASRK